MEGPRDTLGRHLWSSDSVQGTVHGAWIQRRGVISVLREFGTDLRK